MLNIPHTVTHMHEHRKIFKNHFFGLRRPQNIVNENSTPGTLHFRKIKLAGISNSPSPKC